MILLYNAAFYTASGFENDVKAILIDEGKILKLFSELPASTGGYESIDLKGNYAYPGFIDTHTHSFEGGLYSLMLDTSEARCIKELLEMIAAAAPAVKEHLFAWNFDETKLSEQRFPTRAELDSVMPDKCLLLRRMDGHSSIINSFACDEILASGMKDRCDEEILKGFDNDRVVHWFHNNLDEETILASYRAAAQIALKGGFSTIHTMVGDANNSIGHYALLKKHLKDFPIDYILYAQSFNIEAALEVGADRIGGCILADGSIGSSTAAVYEPYEGTPRRGSLYQSDQYWREFITRAHRYNLQVGVHVIGDRAITQINNIYLELANTDYKDLRHMLIHCEMTDDALVNHIKASGAVPVMQPAFDLYWGGDNGFYAKVLGLERARKMNRFATFMKKGITITGSSDWYITPLDINLSLDAAIHHKNPAEALTPAQAIDIYTKNAAWLSHDENNFGQIKAGLAADFSVLNYDVAHATQNPKVKAVIKKGKVVYDKL